MHQNQTNSIAAYGRFHQCVTFLQALLRALSAPSV